MKIKRKMKRIYSNRWLNYWRKPTGLFLDLLFAGNPIKTVVSLTAICFLQASHVWLDSLKQNKEKKEKLKPVETKGDLFRGMCITNQVGTLLKPPKLISSSRSPICLTGEIM